MQIVKKTSLALMLIVTLATFAQTPVRFYQGGKVGYKVDNKVIIEPVYDCGSDYYEGFALVAQEGKFGFLDEKGKLLGYMEYEHAGIFSNGLAKVKKGGKYGYINHQGQFEITCQYDYVTDFSDDVAAVQLNGKWALLSKDGRLITDWDFDYIMQGTDGLFGAKKDNTWGFLNTNGQVALPFNYTMVQAFVSGFAIVGIKDHEGIVLWKIDKTGKKIEKLENEVEEHKREEKKNH